MKYQRVKIVFVEKENRERVKNLREELKELSKRIVRLKGRKRINDFLRKMIEDLEEAEARIIGKLIKLGDF